jgi:hypothetical protein
VQALDEAERARDERWHSRRIGVSRIHHHHVRVGQDIRAHGREQGAALLQPAGDESAARVLAVVVRTRSGVASTRSTRARNRLDRRSDHPAGSAVQPGRRAERDALSGQRLSSTRRFPSGLAQGLVAVRFVILRPEGESGRYWARSRVQIRGFWVAWSGTRSAQSRTDRTENSSLSLSRAAAGGRPRMCVLGRTRVGNSVLREL